MIRFPDFRTSRDISYKGLVAGGDFHKVPLCICIFLCLCLCSFVCLCVGHCHHQMISFPYKGLVAGRDVHKVPLLSADLLLEAAGPPVLSQNSQLHRNSPCGFPFLLFRHNHQWSHDTKNHPPPFTIRATYELKIFLTF